MAISCLVCLGSYIQFVVMLAHIQNQIFLCGCKSHVLGFEFHYVRDGDLFSFTCFFAVQSQVSLVGGGELLFALFLCSPIWVYYIWHSVPDSVRQNQFSWPKPFKSFFFSNFSYLRPFRLKIPCFFLFNIFFNTRIGTTCLLYRY